MDNVELAKIFCTHDPEDTPCPTCIKNAFIVRRKLHEEFKTESQEKAPLIDIKAHLENFDNYDRMSIDDKSNIQVERRGLASPE